MRSRATTTPRSIARTRGSSRTSSSPTATSQPRRTRGKRSTTMVSKALLKKLAKQHGTPLFVVDHDELRANYATWRRHLPRVQAYYAVKANSNPEIVKTFHAAGASFDVASMPEFMLVHDCIEHMPAKERQAWIWDKIIYANPIKRSEE